MPTPLPTPLAAALGIVPTVVTGVRRLPGKAFAMPFHAISTTLWTLGTLRREYDELAERGEQFATWLRGEAAELAEDVADRADVVESRVGEFAGRGSVSSAYDTVEDALVQTTRTVGRQAGATLHAVQDQVEDVVETAASAADSALRGAAAAVDTAVDTAASTTEDVTRVAEDLADPAAKRLSDPAAEPVPEAEQPKGVATPNATEPDSTRIDTAADAAVVETVEQVVAQTRAPEIVKHDDLPLPDYDHMTLGSLRGRLRSLTVEQLTQVRSYEKAHADRLPVVTMLDNRIAKLATDAAAAAAAVGPIVGEQAVAVGLPLEPSATGPLG